MTDLRVVTSLHCGTCTALLNEALNLTVRGRTLDGIQNRADQLACAQDGGEWLASGRFDQHVARNNAKCDPWDYIEPRSLTPQLWAEEMFQRDLHDWETRARKHLMDAAHD